MRFSSTIQSHSISCGRIPHTSRAVMRLSRAPVFIGELISPSADFSPCTEQGIINYISGIPIPDTGDVDGKWGFESLSQFGFLAFTCVIPLVQVPLGTGTESSWHKTRFDPFDLSTPSEDLTDERLRIGKIPSFVIASPLYS